MSLRLPGFALELRLRAPNRSTGSPPLVALSEREGGRDLVVLCSAAATAAGVAPGRSVTAARTLCSGLVVLRADPVAERRALERLAAAMLRFTPDVCLDVERAGAAALQLEIGRTAHHFGGEAALAAQAVALCRSLGFAATTGVEATPEAARVRARAGDATTDLSELPWPALAPEPAIADACVMLGVRTIGDLLRLPRAGLATRTSVAFVQQLQRLRGELTEPLVRIAPPDRFLEELELVDPVTDVGPLLFAAKRLLDAAQALLEGRERALVTATVTLKPLGGGAPVALELAPSEPTRDAALLAQLLAHRLERALEQGILAAPIEKVALAFDRTVPLEPRQDALFERARDRDFERDAAALRDRLAVRLGRERVPAAELREDHRPERAFRWRKHGEARADAAVAPPIPPPAGARPLELERAPRPVAIDVDAEGRPLRLRETSGALELRVARGPERIAAGWWDGHDVERDYFEVEAADGSRFWLFRDPATGAFFRHGSFT
jgi:protein ImuB